MDWPVVHLKSCQSLLITLVKVFVALRKLLLRYKYPRERENTPSSLPLIMSVRGPSDEIPDSFSTCDAESVNKPQEGSQERMPATQNTPPQMSSFNFKPNDSSFTIKYRYPWQRSHIKPKHYPHLWTKAFIRSFKVLTEALHPKFSVTSLKISLGPQTWTPILIEIVLNFRNLLLNFIFS